MFRISVLVSVCVLALGVAVVASDGRFSSAQTQVMIDYDVDDDSLIEVRTRQQLQAIHYDLNGDGTAESRGQWPASSRTSITSYAASYPTAAATMGCGARDHDGNSGTPDQAQCIGYELVNDIHFSGGNNWVPWGKTAHNHRGAGYTGKFVGNGFRVLNVNQGTSAPTNHHMGFMSGVASGGSVEGLVVWNASFAPSGNNANSYSGLFVDWIEGEVIGSAVRHGWCAQTSCSSFAGQLAGSGLVAHSYVHDARAGGQRVYIGGMFGRMRGTSRCLNSYFSGDFQFNRSFGNLSGSLAYVAENTVTVDNCFSVSDHKPWGDATAAESAAVLRTYNDLTNPTGYTGTFEAYDDYAADGTALSVGDDRTDFWYFGDSTTRPVLKAWGHDHTLAPWRGLSGDTNVNLCERTLEVANEIIRHLKDDVRRTGVTSTPADVMSLEPCTSRNDEREVSITNLADLVVTTADHHFDLSPDRTFPAVEPITSLHLNDFAYLPGVAHVDLENNALDQLPPRLFQGLPLRYVDLSNNDLTSIPADLFAGVAGVSAAGGNSILLNNNNLTDTGIPGRVFDSMAHVNGLDLSHNALTKVNTRWFEKLVNLGSKAGGNSVYTHALGLHLGGNTVTEHYYSEKIFTGVKYNVVNYVDVSVGTPPVTTYARDTLLGAIVTTIDDANSARPNLDLHGTSFWFNSGGTTTGYQANTVSSCLNTQLSGPGRFAYLDRVAPACQEQPHWSAPHLATDTAVAAPSISGVTNTNRGVASIRFSHTASAGFVAYQVRYRSGVSDPWTQWFIAPITPGTGTKTIDIDTHDSARGHSVELRVLSTTGPPGTATSAVATAASADWLTGLAATPTRVSIALSWNAVGQSSLPSNHRVVAYFYRFKPASASLYGLWNRVPDGPDAGSDPANETSYTITAREGIEPGTNYNVQVVAGIDGPDADSDVDFFTDRESVNALTVARTTLSPSAAAGTDAATIRVTWLAQTAATNATTRFQVRRKKRATAGWDDSEWLDVPDSDGDGYTYDETGFTLLDLDNTSVYDVQVRLWWSDALGAEPPESTSATPSAVPALDNVAGEDSPVIGSVDLTWDAQTSSTSENAKFQARWKRASDSSFGPWTDIQKSDDSGVTTHDDVSGRVAGFTPWREYDVDVRFVVGESFSPVASLTGVRGGYQPQNFNAVTGPAPGTILVTWDYQDLYTCHKCRVSLQWHQNLNGGHPSGGWWQTGAGYGDGHWDKTSYLITGLTAGTTWDVRANFNKGFTNRGSWEDNDGWTHWNHDSMPRVANVVVAGVLTPQNVTATGSVSAARAIDVSWDMQTASTLTDSKFQYRYRLSTASDWSGATWTDVADSGDDGTDMFDETGVTIGSLTAGTSYEVQVRFYWNSTHGNGTAATATATASTVPGPMNLAAGPGTETGSVDLTWDLVPSATSYQYRHKTSGAADPSPWNYTTVTGGASAASVTVTGLTAGTTYTFQVRARTSANNSSPASVDAAPQSNAAPKSFVASTGSNPGDIAARWTAPTGGTQTGFQYRYKRSSEAAYPATWTDVEDSGTDGRANETSVDIESLWAGVSYDVQIRAEYASAQSLPGPSTTQTASAFVVAAPTGLTATRGTGSGAIDLTWTAIPMASLVSGDTVFRYEYRTKRNDAGDSTYSAWTPIPDGDDGDENAGNETGYTIPGLPGYVAHDIQLRAAMDDTDTAGLAANYTSESASATNVLSGLSAPEMLRLADSTVAGTLNLVWSLQTQFGSTFTTAKYQVRYKRTHESWPGTAPFGWADVASSTRESVRHTVSALFGGGTYDVQLRFVPNATIGASAPASVRGTTPEIAPISNFRATTSVTRANSIDLRWDGQSAAQLPSSEWQVRYKESTAAWPTSAEDALLGWRGVPDQNSQNAGWDESGQTLTGLTAGATYDIEIRFRFAHTVGITPVVSAQVAASSVPAVRNLRATAPVRAPGRTELRWTTITDATYEYRWKVEGADDSTYSGWTGTGAATNYYAVNGLTPNARHTFQFRAIVSSVRGPAATASGPSGFTAWPDNFRASPGTNPGEINLTWHNPGGTYTGFKTRYRRSSQPEAESSYSTWVDVPDVNSDSDRADERAVTLTDPWPGVEYVVQISTQAAAGDSPPTSATGSARALAGPASVTGARSTTTPAAVTVSWTAPVTGVPSGDTVVRYEYRYKFAESPVEWYSPIWTQVPDANSNNDRSDDTSVTITGLIPYREYHVQVRALMDDATVTGTSADYATAPATSASTRAGLASPADLSAAAGTADPGEIVLTWTAQTTFDSTNFPNAKYEVRAKLESASWPAGGGWADVTGSDADTATHTLTGLMNRQTYDIEVRFEPNATIGASPAAEVQGTPTAVTAPTLTAATSTTTPGAIELSWTAQTATMGTEAKYQVRHKVDTAAWPTTATMGWTDVADTGSDGAHNESSLTLSGLTAGETYDVELRFHWSNAVGASAADAEQVDASRVPSPDSFSVTSGTTAGTISVSWDAVTGASYEYRYKVSTAGDSTYTSWTNTSSTSVTLMSLSTSETYTVQLRAQVTGTGTSPVQEASAQAQAQSPPTSFDATQGTTPGTIGLTWGAPVSPSGTVTGFEYRYRRASQPDVPASWLDWTDVPDNPDQTADPDTDRDDERAYTITSLWAGVSYVVQIRTESSGGNSLPGASTTQTETAGVVAAPTNFSASIGDMPGEIDLTWTALIASNLADSSDTVTEYQFRRKLSSASVWGNWTNMPPANTASYTITGLTAGTQYDIELRAAIDDNDDAGTVADYYSSSDDETGIYAGIARPANLMAAAGTSGPGVLVLRWDAQTTFMASAFSDAKYRFRYRLTGSGAYPATGAGSWADVPSSDASTTTHTISGILNGRQYDVQVSLHVNSDLGQSAATQVTGTTSAIAVPQDLLAETATDAVAAIDLRWTSQNAVTGAAKYQYRTKLTSAVWGSQTWNDVPDSTSDSVANAWAETAYQIASGLTAGMEYNIQLRLFLSTAVGGSQPATATVRASRVPVPQSFAASTGSNGGEIRISWAAVSGATGYEFRYRLRTATAWPASGATGDWSSAGTGTSHTITNLSNGMHYQLQLRATAANNSVSDATETREAQAQTTPGPATLTTDVGDDPGDIKLEWTAPAMSAPVEHYEYRYKLETATAYPATWTKVPDADSDTDFSDETTVTISGLTADVRYDIEFRVFASQALGYSLPLERTQASRRVPPPTSMTATGGTNPGEVNLRWTAPTGVTILRYEVRHRLGTTGAWSGWASVGNVTAYTYTGLLAGAQRTFEVRAVMETVGASAADDATGTPTPVPVPGNFSAATGTFPGEVKLTWGAVTGATSYEYRYRLGTATTWPDDAWLSVAGTLVETTVGLLDENANYRFELRAVITNVGMSNTTFDTVTARSGTIIDAPTARPIPAGEYTFDSRTHPGRIAINLPGNTNPFIYRYRTHNPGEWSRWFKVVPDEDDMRYFIPGLMIGTVYNIEVRAYLGETLGFTTARSEAGNDGIAPAPYEMVDGFTAEESSGIIKLEWQSPALFTPDRYEYRWRQTGTVQWSDWMTILHEGDQGSPQQHWVTDLESGISHDFQLQMVTAAGESPIANASGTARLRVPEVQRIRPEVREVTVRAGDQIALTVDVYNAQNFLENGFASDDDSQLKFSWREIDADGNAVNVGGSFTDAGDPRRRIYTVPDAPGVYYVSALAMPDGICTGDHVGSTVDPADKSRRAQCTAMFTIRAVARPAVELPRPDPVDPAVIPATLRDADGADYAVFTPTSGGTYTSDAVTVTAAAGAVPDRTYVGISAAASEIEPPPPIPGASLAVAGRYQDLQAITADGEAPVQSYKLNEPVTVCLPFPDEFRADLSNVVLVQRKTDGELALLSTRIRVTAGEFAVCGALSTLPATVGVARVGTVPQPAPDRESVGPGIENPDTGGWSPRHATWTMVLVLGVLALVTARLTGIYRTRQMN